MRVTGKVFSIVLVNRWAVRHSGLSREHPNSFSLPKMDRDGEGSGVSRPCTWKRLAWLGWNVIAVQRLYLIVDIRSGRHGR